MLEVLLFIQNYQDSISKASFLESIDYIIIDPFYNCKVLLNKKVAITFFFFIRKSQKLKGMIGTNSLK